MEGGVARGVVEGEGIVAAPTQDGGPVSIVPGVDGVIAGTHVSDVVAADTGEGVVASPCVDGFSAIKKSEQVVSRIATGDQGEGGSQRRRCGGLIDSRSLGCVLRKPLWE